MGQMKIETADGFLVNLTRARDVIGEECAEVAAKFTGEKRDQLIRMVQAVTSDLRAKVSRMKSPTDPIGRLMKLIEQVRQLANEARQAADARFDVGVINLECDFSRGLESFVQFTGATRAAGLVIQAKKTFQVLWNGLTALDLDFWYALVKDVALNSALKAIDMVEGVVLAMIGGAAKAVQGFVQRRGTPSELYAEFRDSVVLPKAEGLLPTLPSLDGIL